jgi:primase-polymerase (primpol)-like protein
MGTRFSPRPDGKLNKPPYRVRSALPIIKADKTDPENRATFEEGRAALGRGEVDAIGFVFTDEDRYTGLDLDDALDPETGEIEPWAAEIVADFPTYWEISTSGTGLRGICIGSKPGTDCKKESVEIYDGRTTEDGRSRARFMVLTGRAIGPVREIRDCQEQINTLYHKLFPKTTKSATQARSTKARESSANVATAGTRLLKPEELLKKARNSRKGKQFIKLFDYGNRSGYSGNNEADMGLLNILAFWCSGDPDYMEEMFKRSALFRPPPEKHHSYVAISV